MDGVQIIIALLLADTDIVTDVTAAKVKPGPLPVGTAPPALSVAKVSGADRNIPSPGANRRVTERIQITALGRTYPEMKDTLKLAKGACADFVGSVAGATDVTVHTDAAGPDFTDDQASLFMSSQDFIVGYTEPR